MTCASSGHADAAAYLWSLYALVFGAAGQPGTRLGMSWLGSGETRAKGRSGAALRARLSLGAKDAAVIRDGRKLRVPVGQFVGDEWPGRERRSTDGMVVSGTSAVDTSMLTGEPVPAEVNPGDRVIGGCVNAAGRLVVRAPRVGADTQLAQMAPLVTEAPAGKAPVQRLASPGHGIAARAIGGDDLTYRRP